MKLRLPKITVWRAIFAVILLAGAYATYLRITKGSWLAWYSAQAEGWGRTLTWPWDSFAHTLRAIVPGAYADHPGWAWVFRAEVVSIVVGIVVTVACLVLKRWAEATWVGVQVVAFATSYWYMSVNRAVLLWFPLWLLLGSFATRPGKTRTARILVIITGGIDLSIPAMMGVAAVMLPRLAQNDSGLWKPACTASEWVVMTGTRTQVAETLRSGIARILRDSLRTLSSSELQPPSFSEPAHGTTFIASGAVNGESSPSLSLTAARTSPAC